MGSRLQMHIENPVKHLRWSLKQKVNGFYLLTISAKHSILDVWQGSDYASGLFKLFCCGSKRDTPKNWYMPNIYIRSRLRLFSYSELTHISTTFKLKKRQSTIKFGVFVLCFIFFIRLSQAISVINRNDMCYFLHASK